MTAAAPSDVLIELALRVQHQTAGLLCLIHAVFPPELDRGDGLDGSGGWDGLPRSVEIA